MKVSYGVTWREESSELHGRLAVGPGSLRLRSHDPDGAVVRELALGQMAALELLEPEENGGRPAVALSLRDGRRIVIESAVGRWIYSDLAEQVLEEALGPGSELHVGLGL